MYQELIFILVLLILITIFAIIGFLSEGSSDTSKTEAPADVVIEATAEEPKIISEQIIDQSGTNIVPVVDNTGNTFLYVTLSILSLTTLLSIAISFYLYKWRRILLSNNNMVVPEEWAKYLKKVGKSMEGFRKSVGDDLQRVANATNNNTEKISNMTDTYMELQSALDEKDAEIKRLKKGYDAEIFRRFILRFARIEQTIDDIILEDGEKEFLSHLKRLFEDAFDECGVSKYEPVIGEDYRKAIGVSDNPKTIATSNPDEEFLISEVLESGYQLNTAINKEVIIPAKVRIYKL